MPMNWIAEMTKKKYNHARTTFRGHKNVPLRNVVGALGISYARVYRWCVTRGKTGDDIEASFRKKPVLIEINGEKHTRAEWQRILGINKMTVSSRLYLGWSIEEALTTPPKPVVRRKERSGE